MAGLLRWKNNQATLLNKLYLFLTKYRALSPYILAQAKLETANFTSNLYKKTNNAFGMQHPVKRPAVGYESDSFEGGMERHLQAYRNDTQSIQDLLLWMDYTKFPKRVSGAEQYVRELAIRKYFTAKESDYLKGLNSWR